MFISLLHRLESSGIIVYSGEECLTTNFQNGSLVIATNKEMLSLYAISIDLKLLVFSGHIN